MIHTQERTSYLMLNELPQPVIVSVSCFAGESGVEEYHMMISPTEYASAETQMEWIAQGYQAACQAVNLEAGSCVFRRFFCSDLPNQAASFKTQYLSSLGDPLDPCAVSWVCQPPMPPAKVGLWAYHVKDSETPLEKQANQGSLEVRRGDLSHLWTTGFVDASVESSCDQTALIMERYRSFLKDRQMSLADNVIRTWFFVQNVDANYAGFVKSRKDIFSEDGLTPETHFIASTGIQGSSGDVQAKVLMDAYAVSGVRDEQIEFLHAPEHLSPTHIYGVTFERGVSVEYRDRKQIFISGTASIDRIGDIVHPGDVSRQLDRTLENIEALLKEADAAMEDISMFVVYVRDSSDLQLVRRMMDERFCSVPMQIVTAPVCRPGWLIELECQAIVPSFNPQLPPF